MAGLAVRVGLVRVRAQVPKLQVICLKTTCVGVLNSNGTS